MSALREALERLDGRNAEAVPAWQVRTVVEDPLVQPPPPAEAVTETSAESDPPGEFDEFATLLIRNFPSPALIAFVTCGVTEPITNPLRELAEAVAKHTHGDIVLLGPGSLDDPESLTEQWGELRRRAAFGFIHASADHVGMRIDGLRQVAAVVPVVELGFSSKRAVGVLRSILARSGIPILGTVVIDDC